MIDGAASKRREIHGWCVCRSFLDPSVFLFVSSAVHFYKKIEIVKLIFCALCLTPTHTATTGRHRQWSTKASKFFVKIMSNTASISRHANASRHHNASHHHQSPHEHMSTFRNDTENLLRVAKGHSWASTTCTRRERTIPEFKQTCDGLATMNIIGGAEYRLGDLFNGYLARHHAKYVNQMNLSRWNGAAVFCGRWPSSIGCEYCLSAQHDIDKDAMYRAVQVVAESNPGIQPDSDAVVIHLRLGDVFDWKERYNCALRNLQKNTSCLYSNPAYVYKALVMKLPKLVTHVWIVGNPMYRAKSLRHGGNVSISFAEHVIKEIESILPVRGVRFNTSADDDLIFMARSHYLIPARGGYGSLAALAATRMSNATVLYLPK